MVRILQLFQLTLKTIGWIQRVFTLNEIRPIGEFRYLTEALLRVGNTRGLYFLIEYIKNVRVALLLHLSGEYPSKRVQGVRVTHDGVPLVLGPLIKYCRRGHSPVILRIVNTILFSTRALNLGKEPDISPIVGPALSDRLPTWGKSVSLFWKELGYRPFKGHTPGSLRFKQYHFTSKSGPNGHALWTSLADLYMIPPEMMDHIRIVGGPKLSMYMDNLLKAVSFLSLLLPSKGQSLRKLSWFPDKELKVRVIAIGDYWSQIALKPLHHYLFRVLKKIPQDCTFDQSSFKDKVSTWTEFYSIDLSNATDRFPIQTIYDVLVGHLPEEYCQSWKWLIVGIPFDFQGNKISYTVGNPMGFYSSWASFTVAHHFVMFYCCQELKISWKEAKYVILGDDVLIGDLSLKNKYVEMMTRLGVTFSPLKTHESFTLFEFAKRLFFKGQEVTPFPISSLKEVSKRYYLLVNLLAEQEVRGWIPVEGIPQAIGQFYKLVSQKNSKFSAKLRDKSYFSDLIMKVIRGTIAADKALNTLIGYFGYQIRQLTEQESLGILSNVAVESFAESNPANAKGGGYPLGKLAEDLVLAITGVEEPTMLEHLISITHMVPHLAVYGLIEESYINISKEAFRIDTVGGGDWPLLLVTIALPLDDRVFVQRQSHLVSKASAIMGEHLKKRFSFLASPIGRAILGPET